MEQLWPTCDPRFIALRLRKVWASKLCPTKKIYTFGRPKNRLESVVSECWLCQSRRLQDCLYFATFGRKIKLWWDVDCLPIVKSTVSAWNAVVFLRQFVLRQLVRGN